MASLLEIQNLSTSFRTPYGTVLAVDDVSLSLEQGETLGVVGESGCGKTVLALSLMRLVPEPPGQITGRAVLFNGTDLLKLSREEMRSIRGKDISMIFQEPMTALNPVFRIGDQVIEAIRQHQDITKRDAATQAVDMLRQVGLPQPEKRIRDYPHQLSGGMRQRIMIAMALVCKPRLMLADEPTTALDVTIQAQILHLLNDLKQELKTAIVLITHDLGVVAETAQQVAVMYAGQIVEYADVESLFNNAMHPYTLGLLESIPPLDQAPSKEFRLNTIRGTVPEPGRDLKGCRFQDRCLHAMAVCGEKQPELKARGASHTVRCWKYE